MEQPAWHPHPTRPEQPQIQSQTSLSYALPEPREEPKVCKKRIESTSAWPSSSSSPLPFLPAGSAAISDHPPCEDCDGFGCESVTVTQVVLVPGGVGTPSPAFRQLLDVRHQDSFDPVH